MNRNALIVILFVAVLAAVGSCALWRNSKTKVTPPPVVRISLPDPVAVVLYDNSGNPRPCTSAQFQGPVGRARLSFGPVVQTLRTRRRAQPLPPLLARYCVIRPKPPTTTQGPLLRPRIPLREAERLRKEFEALSYKVGFDYPLVGASADLDLMPRAEQRQAFRERAGAPDPINTSWPDPLPSVRLALIDSLDGSGSGWTYANLSSDGHGAPLGRLIEELTCVEGNGTKKCLVDLRAYDALKDTSPTGQPAGALHDLANAIMAAADDDAGSKVINISLGWVPLPSLGNHDPSQPMPMPIQAVYDALKYAACHKGVVFAAAGNYLGGPTGTFDDGLLYPAAWQGPTTVSCTKYGTSGTFKGSLVQAVGGVGAEGQKMALTRPAGFPTLAAFGVDGVSLAVPKVSTKPKDHTLPMSGTSVATAVVSAAAAAHWAFQASLDNVAIADALRNSISALPDLTADISFGGTNLVKKIKVCDLAIAACAGGNCGGTFACPSIGSPVPTQLTLNQIAATLTSVPMPALQEKQCVGHSVWGAKDHITCMNGFTTSIDATPWVHPMPGCDPCLGCVLRVGSAGTSELFGELDITCLESAGAWLVRHDGTQQTILDVGGIIEDGGFVNQFTNGGILLSGIPLSMFPATATRMVFEAKTSQGDTTTAAELPFGGP